MTWDAANKVGIVSSIIGGIVIVFGAAYWVFHLDARLDGYDKRLEEFTQRAKTLESQVLTLKVAPAKPPGTPQTDNPPAATAPNPLITTCVDLYKQAQQVASKDYGSERLSIEQYIRDLACADVLKAQKPK